MDKAIAYVTISLLMLLIGGLFGFAFSADEDARFAAFESRLAAFEKKQKDLEEWRKFMARSAEQQEKYRQHFEADLAWKQETSRQLDLLGVNMDRMACAVCVAGGGRCRKLCSPPKTVPAKNP